MKLKELTLTRTDFLEQISWEQAKTFHTAMTKMQCSPCQGNLWDHLLPLPISTKRAEACTAITIFSINQKNCFN